MKIPNRFSLFCTLFASSVSLVSCTLADEFDKVTSIESVEATGSFNANILNETWLLKDLIPAQKLNLIEGSDGNYSLGFENSSSNDIETPKFPAIELDPVNTPLGPLNYLKEYNDTPAEEYFTAPAAVINFDIPKPEIEGNPFSDDLVIKNIKLSYGAQITLDLDIDSNSDTQVTVIIPSITKNGVPYNKTIGPIIGSSNKKFIMNDLDGYILSPSPKVTAIIQSKVKKITNPIDGSIKASLNIDIANHHEYVEGFFGEMELPIHKIEFPFSMPEDFKGTENSQMTLKEATIILKMNQSGYNFPVDLDLSKGNLCYYKGNNTPKEVEIVPVLGLTDANTFKFKIKNINVFNIEKLVLNPVITINKGLTEGSNKITALASITYDVSTNLPLDIEAEDLAFEQESENLFYEDKTEINESDYELIDGKIMLKGSINSEIPMGASLQVYYKHNSEDDTYLDTLFDQPINVTANGSSNFLTSITKEKLDVLKKYKFQVMKITLNGSGAIMSGQKINVKLGVAAKGTIKTKF